MGKSDIDGPVNTRAQGAPESIPLYGAKDDREAILPLTRHADGRLSVAGNVDRDIHAIMAHMESELLNLPDYATAKFRALLAELKAKL
jgi:hypothetical protein